MQDFVAKPVIPENLFSMLVKWLPRMAGADPFESTVAQNLVDAKVDIAKLKHLNGDSAKPVDPGALSEIFGNDIAAQLAILQKFATHTERIVEDFEMACRQRDAEKVSFHTHKLKSSARTVGADNLADICFALEVAGRNENWGEIDDLFGLMRPAMERVKDHILSL